MEIIHIPKRFHNSDVPPPSAESIAAALAAQAKERDEATTMFDVETLRELCERRGYARIARWVRSLAAIHGQEV